jgi:hypothetical protein
VQPKFSNTLKHLNSTLIAAALFMATSVVFAAGSASTSVVSGYVTATSTDGQVTRVESGDEHEAGVQITTGENSSVSIVLANGEVVEVGPLSTYIVGKSAESDDKGDGFAKRSLNSKSPTLSTATSAGGGIAPTTPSPGGSPTL